MSHESFRGIGVRRSKLRAKRVEAARVRSACSAVAERLETRTLLSSVVTTAAASLVSSTGATLNGTVNPQGSTANAEFQYSTSSLFTPTIQTTLGSGFTNPHDVAVDAAGDVFVADSGNNAVKEIQTSGTIKTIGSGFSGDDGVAVDAAGDVFVADTGHSLVKEVLASDNIFGSTRVYSEPQS